MMPVMMKPFMTQSLKISVILHPFVRALLGYKDIISFRKLQRCFLVAPHRDRLSGTHPAAVNHLTVGQLLYSSDCMGTGRTAQRDAKANFWFGNTARKQWTLSGFLQHTSTNTIYIENNKNNQQLKVLLMNIKCFKVSHNSQANFCTRTQLLS